MYCTCVHDDLQCTCTYTVVHVLALLVTCKAHVELCFLFHSSSVVCVTLHGDNESLLLLCDGCDRGTHTYCCSPKLDIIPEGDWYCHSCVINVSVQL